MKRAKITMICDCPLIRIALALSLIVNATVDSQLIRGACPRGNFFRVDENFETLGEALVRDNMPPSSSKCISPQGQTSHSFKFESSQEESQWYDEGMYRPYEDLEQYVFLAKMSHMDENENRTWTIRLGQGGNIYSFVGPMGETVARQDRPASPWVDEVWQSISVSMQETMAEGSLYFIREAGVLQEDTTYTSESGIPLTEVPFFSPHLGHFCRDGECGFMSWGQQFYVPTEFSSTMINMNRYKDCGNGIIEYTTLRHKNNDGDSVVIDHINVPWGGVRPSILKDIVLTSALDEENPIEVLKPVPSWNTDTTRELEDTLGYIMWVENAQSQLYEDGEPYLLPEDLNITISDPGCFESEFHSNQFNRLAVVCYLEPTIGDNSGSDGLEIRFTLNTGQEFYATVHHWSWADTNLFYFFPVEMSLSEIIDLLQPGVYVTEATYVENGYPDDENLALGHVFGTNNSLIENGGVSTTNAFIRYGKSNRDYQVYTVNSDPIITNGDTHYYRQYFMVDLYSDMQETGKEWAPEAYQDMYDIDNTPQGRSVELFTKLRNGKYFGAVVGKEAGTGCRDEIVPACGPNGPRTDLPNNIESVCIGSTTPKAGMQALYQVECGPLVAVTSDPYYFAPSGFPRRPYICSGMRTKRPTWTLLGFFALNDCDAIGTGHKLDDDFCWQY